MMNAPTIDRTYPAGGGFTGWGQQDGLDGVSLPGAPSASAGASGAGETPFWMQRWGGGAAPTYTPAGGGGVSWSTVSAPSPYAGSFNYAAERFNAPTGLTMENDPGYKARMRMGTEALENSAAARGTLLTGGTAKALAQYGQDYASNEFSNVFNRALQGYQANESNRYNAAALNQSGALQAHGIDAGNQMQAAMANAQGQMSAQQYNANAARENAQFGYNAQLGAYDRAYNAFRADQDAAFSRPYSLAQLGYNAASNAANQYGNYATNDAAQVGNYWTGGANAVAAGQVGAGNAWSSGLSNLGNLGMNAYYMNRFGPSRTTQGSSGYQSPSQGGWSLPRF